MTLDDLIAELQVLKRRHGGNVPVYNSNGSPNSGTWSESTLADVAIVQPLVFSYRDKYDQAYFRQVSARSVEGLLPGVLQALLMG